MGEGVGGVGCSSRTKKVSNVRVTFTDFVRLTLYFSLNLWYDRPKPFRYYKILPLR